jgi:hypothetical protein
MKLYISSYDYNDFEIPRKVIGFERFQLDGKDILAIKVKQPLIGQKYGLLGNDITKFYLVNRVDESAFKNLNKFPIDVHILVVKSSATIEPNSLEELQNIAWGCLYDNKQDAKEHRVI